jgi:hypothetical protein
MTRIQTEKHWSMGGWLRYMPMNSLPQLEALRIDLLQSVGAISFGMRHCPTRDIHQLKSQPSKRSDRVQLGLRSELERQVLARAAKALPVRRRKSEYSSVWGEFKEFPESASNVGANSKLKRPQASARPGVPEAMRFTFSKKEKRAGFRCDFAGRIPNGRIPIEDQTQLVMAMLVPIDSVIRLHGSARNLEKGPSSPGKHLGIERT